MSAIGGLTGGRANAKAHTWTVYDLRPPDRNRQRLEGQGALPAETRVRGQDRNVLEIYQETVGVTYARQSTQNMFAGTGAANANAAAIGGTNAVPNEMDWQTRQALVQIVRDVELTFLVGRYQEPTENSTVRKTRGILEAIRTNATPQPLTEVLIIDVLQKVWENGGVQIS